MGNGWEQPSSRRETIEAQERLSSVSSDVAIRALTSIAFMMSQTDCPTTSWLHSKAALSHQPLLLICCCCLTGLTFRFFEHIHFAPELVWTVAEHIER